MERTLLEINQIDVLIHPDYSLKYYKDSLVTPAHIQRRKAWMKRGREVAENPKAILFYFSTFLRGTAESNSQLIPDLGDKNLPVILEDQIRRQTLKELLGHRFLLFAGNHYPSVQQLEQHFKERRFWYNPKATSLFAYGEYYDDDGCVNHWGLHLQEVLGLTFENYNRLIGLSLQRSENPNGEKTDAYIRESLFLSRFF